MKKPARSHDDSLKPEGGEDLRRLQARVDDLEQTLAESSALTAEREAELETRLNSFAIPMGGWFWESDAEHRFSYFSPSVFDITGVPPEWHYGKTREEIGNPNSVSAKDWQKYLQTIANHQPFTDFVFQRHGPDGSNWMRTSGMPVFAAGGEFLGYRGSATDVTREIEAEQRAVQLRGVIDELKEIFVLWDPEDRLVICNRQFREINAKVIETTEPGTTFEDHIRAALAAGLYPNAAGQEEDWVADRIKRHQNPTGAFEIKRQDGRWILLDEQKLADGSITTISTDITERKRIEQAIEEKNQILETALRTIPDGVQVLDQELNLVAWNDQLFEVLDLDQAAILGADNPGKAFRYALAGRGEYGEGDLDTLVAEREAIAKTPVPVEYERQLVTGKWMECRGNPILGGGYLAVYRDISERKQVQERLETLASTDALTGIANRRSFMEIANSEFHRTQRYQRPLSFLLLDIDHFKAVNDQYGHATGDETLRQVVAACLQVLRTSDAIGRFGGEEFAVMLPETDIKGGQLMAERLRLAVAETVVKTENGELQVTISIGVAMTNDDHPSPEAVISDADEALYVAKRGGRNRVALR